MSILNGIERADGAPSLRLGVARGADFAHQIIIDAEDWTTNTFEASISPYPDAPSGEVAMTVSTPVLVNSSTEFTLSLTDLQTEALPSADQAGCDAVLFYEVRSTTSAGVTSCILFGEFRVHGRAIA